MTRTATPAQTARIEHIATEVKAAGGRFTTRVLPNGTVRVTERSCGEKNVGLLDLDGNWLTTAKAPAKAPAKATLSADDIPALVVTTLVSRLDAATREALRGYLSPQERLTLDSALERGLALRAARAA